MVAHDACNVEAGVRFSQPPPKILFVNGKVRRVYLHACERCGQDFWAPLYQKRRFCGKSCSRAKDPANTISLECYVCKTIFERRKAHVVKSIHGFYFCSRKCKEYAQSIDGLNLKIIQPSHYGRADYRFGYRTRALRHYGAKCAECGYSEHQEMLDVDHVDGNRKHNSLQNLRVLCVWCHAWKTRMMES